MEKSGVLTPLSKLAGRLLVLETITRFQQRIALESQDGQAKKYKEAAEFQFVHSDSGQIELTYNIIRTCIQQGRSG